MKPAVTKDETKKIHRFMNYRIKLVSDSGLYPKHFDMSLDPDYTDCKKSFFSS